MNDIGARFLTRPDMFPGRIAGEAWGTDDIALALPPGRYRLSGLNEKQRASVESRFPTRVRPAGPDDLVIRTFPMAAHEFTDFETAGWMYSMDFDHQPQRIRMAGVGFVGIIDLAPSASTPLGFSVTGAALWSAEESTLSVGVLENFLRVVVSYQMLAAGGVMLHSAAVVRDNRARVFVGHSGAGKSTVSSLSAACGDKVLSDDINTLVPSSKGGFMVDQIPFAGDFGSEQLSEGTYPLAGIYRLEQAKQHALEPLSKAAALALLVANAPFVNADEHRTDRLVEVLSSLVLSIQAHRLRFCRDAGFWDVLS